MAIRDRVTAEATAQGARQRVSNVGAALLRIPWETAGLPIALVLLCGIFAVLTPYFFTVSNLANVARQVSFIALIAWGQTLVILSAGIDLSVGAGIALVSVLSAMGFGEGITLGVLYGVGAGLAVGLTNGLLIGTTRLAPFIVTLGMLSIAKGLALTISGGVPIFLNQTNSPFFWVGQGYLGPIPAPVLFSASGLVITWVILNRTRFGTYVYAIGGNEEAAVLAGISVKLVKTAIYALTGLFTGIAGVLLTARVVSGQPLLGDGYELQTIAAVVIGGTSLFGGKGGLVGTVFGILLIGVLQNGLNLIGVSTFIQQIVIGAAIILAVLLSIVRTRAASLT